MIITVELSTAGALNLLPDGVVDVAIWGPSRYFALGIGLNATSRSRSERLVITAVVLVLAVACLVLALRA